MALRAVAAKYASELSSGTSFSSTSSSSSGYPSSYLTSSSTSTTQQHTANVLGNASSSSKGSSSSSSSSSNWIREGLPLLEFQHQVLQQLREIWLEERRKMVVYPNSAGGGNPNPHTNNAPLTTVRTSSSTSSSVLMSPISSSSSSAFLAPNGLGGVPMMRPYSSGVPTSGSSSSASADQSGYPNNTLMSSSHPFHPNGRANSPICSLSNNVVNPACLDGPGPVGRSPAHLRKTGGGGESQEPRTPFRHQYLQHVIMSGGSSYHPLGGDSRQIYTPGIYLVRYSSFVLRCSKISKTCLFNLQYRFMKKVSIYCKLKANKTINRLCFF